MATISWFQWRRRRPYIHRGGNWYLHRCCSQHMCVHTICLAIYCHPLTFPPQILNDITLNLLVNGTEPRRQKKDFQGQWLQAHASSSGYSGLGGQVVSASQIGGAYTHVLDTCLQLFLPYRGMCQHCQPFPSECPSRWSSSHIWWAVTMNDLT